MTTLWPTPPDWHHRMVSRVHRVPGICLAVMDVTSGRLTRGSPPERTQSIQVL